ncbi:Carboxylesterase 4A, partial [Araneus ventricosus]
LLDILEALRWVKSNIKFFGGDEGNITLFGQSSGAITIGMLMTSPLARGLFARAIFQSGSPANLDAEDNSRDFELSQNVSEAVGCTSDGNSLTDNPEEALLSPSFVRQNRSNSPCIMDMNKGLNLSMLAITAGVDQRNSELEAENYSLRIGILVYDVIP